MTSRAARGAPRARSKSPEGFTVGAFVQANFGIRRELVVAGVPVGRHLPGGEVRSTPGGSVIGILATDAPLLPHQLKRLARRMALGIGRTGSVSHNGSGDIFLAFSTANAGAVSGEGPRRAADFLENGALDPLFTGVVEAVDEAVIDAMVANRTMTGRDGTTVIALPHDRLVELLGRYNRLAT